MVGKQPLTVFLGAGASVGLGVPSTAAVTDAVASAMQRAEDQSRSLLDLPRSPYEPSPVDALRARLDLHYPPQANFEHILHALEAASSLARSWRASTVGRHRIVEAALASGVHPSLTTVFNAEFLVRARSELFAELHRLVDVACSQLTNSANWPAVKSFYERLEAEFDLAVVTTNYDTIIENALGWGADEQGFELVSGEKAWRFSQPQGPVRFAKLHGSIHFGYRSGAVDHNRFRFHDDFDDLYWHPTPAEAVRSWAGRSTPSSQAGRDTTVGPLITGLQKPDKLLAEPYASYYRRFGAALTATPRLLVIGYGFGDPHVNSVLRRMTTWHGPARRIAFVDWRNPDTWFPASGWAQDHADNLRTSCTGLRKRRHSMS